MNPISQDCDLTPADLAVLGWLSRRPSSRQDLELRFGFTMGAKLDAAINRLHRDACIVAVDGAWRITGKGAGRLDAKIADIWIEGDEAGSISRTRRGSQCRGLSVNGCH